MFGEYNTTSLSCSGPNVCKFDIKKKLFAVSHHPSCGPIFGAGADLFISDNCNKVQIGFF